MPCGYHRFQAKDIKTIEVDVDETDDFSLVRIFAISGGGEKVAFELTPQHLEVIVQSAQRAMAKFRAGVREH
ncbi:MAG: hypothetical protein JWM36_2710 [Hyphomicrobiales bacterium]|nr:hypothetical protein [Hyphomicrobiales bacterium]